jgi:hypothetical protein
MKKMVIYFGLMIALATAAFAKPVVIDAGYCYIIADDEVKPYDFSGFETNEQVVNFIVSCFPEEVDGKKTVYENYSMVEVDSLAEKYSRYTLVAKNKTCMLVVEKINDDMMIEILFLLK